MRPPAKKLTPLQQVTSAFDPNCRACPRLAQHLARVRKDFPSYHAGPVAAFGDPKARLLIVGLAPGMHGANRTGRPFTGDFAGILLYQTLHHFGFASHAESVSIEDGLQLRDCRITNAVKCLPPANKPENTEIVRCNRYLEREIKGLARGSIILALGLIAHNAVLRAMKLKLSDRKFTHGQKHSLPDDLCLLDSYHCSRYNTQTKRLTPAMFTAVVRKAQGLLI